MVFPLKVKKVSLKFFNGIRDGFPTLLHQRLTAHPIHHRLGCAVSVHEAAGIAGCGLLWHREDESGRGGSAEACGAEVVCGEREDTEEE